MSEALEKARLAKAASRILSCVPASKRSEVINAAARHVEAASGEILAANAKDMIDAREGGMAESMLDRLLLDEDRITAIVSAMREVAAQEDPLNKVTCGRTLTSGVRMEQVTVPIGVVAIIYEARPNVTADAAALCLRSGNACVLKSGTAALRTSMAIVKAIRAAAVEVGLPADCVCLLESPGHEEANELMRANGLVDVIIPRGGASLIKTCVRAASVPVIETGIGNCHIYLHSSAGVDMAVDVTVNAKCSRPGVCNSAESLLVDRSAASRLLVPVCQALSDAGVELVGDEDSRAVAEEAGIPMGVATEDDWGREYDALKMSVACVDGIEQAISHINLYGTGHSESIIASDYEAGERFLAGVDAAAVYVNASTRFTDGGVFGLGAEIGISTQKLHARGPMGAAELTSTKYLLRGDGQTR